MPEHTETTGTATHVTLNLNFEVKKSYVPQVFFPEA
jgi:hypothetical protein